MKTVETTHAGVTDPFPLDLSGRTALVTGSGRGIGRATALLFGRSGATVVVNDLRGDVAERVAGEISQAGGRSVAVSGDVSKEDDVRNILARVTEADLQVDLLVNNAGVSAYRPLLECTAEDWDRHVDVMAKGTFLMIRAFAPSMLERRFGCIVNLGSYVAQGNCATRYFGPYCAAKYAVVGLTEVAAQELAPYVTVNAVGPGDVATEMMEQEWEQEAARRGLDPGAVREEYRKRLLLESFERPDDIAEAIAFLCSPYARQITGTHLIVSGGLPYRRSAV